MNIYERLDLQDAMCFWNAVCSSMRLQTANWSIIGQGNDLLTIRGSLITWSNVELLLVAP